MLPFPSGSEQSCARVTNLDLSVEGELVSTYEDKSPASVREAIKNLRVALYEPNPTFYPDTLGSNSDELERSEEVPARPSYISKESKESLILKDFLSFFI